MNSGGRVVVTGMGVFSSIGKSVEEYGQSLRAGQSGIGFYKGAMDTGISVSVGAWTGDISYETLVTGYSLPGDLAQKAKQCARRSPFALQATALSAMEAWKGAMLYDCQIPSDRLGIIIAGHNLTQCFQYGLLNKFKQNPEYLTPSYALHYMDTDYLGTLSEIFGIQGEGFTAGGSSASGNVGIIKGLQIIRLGTVDACMVVGPLTDLSPMDLQGFYNIGAMGGRRFKDNPEKACRPFDREHEGFIYGQAGGCLILESMESAAKRGVPILAELLGGALVLDGNRLSNPSAEGEARAMEYSLKQAGVESGQVDYLNAHGSSSPLGDETEVAAIKKVFKKSLPRMWINSGKSMTGHCLCAAGVVEAVATIIQIREGFVHPNLNLDNPIDNECRFNDGTAKEADIEMAMSNSFGFGGINTSIIFKKVVP
ncbi:MAG: hypothetical protein JL50_19370 [Peptococcaceae bacterium BICA1-7]|nr:MAG: hypothetical protein JL50_19370 [Peptococcaceae bacterium BICA1-7]HBV98899.1 beta-ketoacyl-ACP synthase [Desulfotomaculum sp.]